MSVAGKDKLSELIARKLMKQMKWMKGKMVKDGVKRRKGEKYSYLKCSKQYNTPATGQ